MTPQLTKEQCDAIQQHGGKPVAVVDPMTSKVFYLVSSEQFDFIRTLLASDSRQISETYSAQEAAVRPLWDDPALDVYNEPSDRPSAP